MGWSRDATVRAGAIAALAALAVGVGLGRSGRLTYHEAIWAQTARELNAGGGWLIPRLDGRPWLEKPPLGTWSIALAGRLAGRVDEATARLPAALAAVALALTAADLAARHFGGRVGLLAGLVQITTAWTVMRGRLAEADMILAALVAGALAAFDGLRRDSASPRRPGTKGAIQRAAPDRPGLFRLLRSSLCAWAPWRDTLLFFFLLGLTSLAKGLGFGAALVLATVAAVLIWDRDGATARRLASPLGWLLAALMALAWPLAVLARYPEALQVWALHVTDRLGGPSRHFAGESWREYALSPFWQTLPWTPLALVGSLDSWRRARAERGGPDRLLWAWAVVPAALVSAASVRNAHYLIHALPPWSIWAALRLERLGARLRAGGWSAARLRRVAVAGFAGLGLAYGLGFALVGPRLDRRGAEWAWYATAARAIPPGEPLVLLYDDWDKAPYPTPFGPVPADLAVRLFYLDRPARWHPSPATLAPPGPGPFAVIARDRDVPDLRRLGRVETLGRGPRLRARASRALDRAFVLFRITPVDPGVRGDIQRIRVEVEASPERLRIRGISPP